MTCAVPMPWTPPRRLYYPSSIITIVIIIISFIIVINIIRMIKSCYPYWSGQHGSDPWPWCPRYLCPRVQSKSRVLNVPKAPPPRGPALCAPCRKVTSVPSDPHARAAKVSDSGCWSRQRARGGGILIDARSAAEDEPAISIRNYYISKQLYRQHFTARSTYMRELRTTQNL